MAKKWAVMAALCSAVAVSWAHAEPQVFEPSAVQNQADMQPVAAAYRVEWKEGRQARKPQTWYFIREPGRAMIMRGQMDDIWTRDGKGAIALERVFHQDRSVVVYTPGELVTLGVTPNWRDLNSLFDASKLPALKPVGPLGSGVIRYAGRVGGERIELDWAKGLDLPQRLHRSSGHRSVRFTLLEQHPQAPASWRVPEQQVDTYQRFDAADFGDMESDPFIQKASHMDVMVGWRMPHDHE